MAISIRFLSIAAVLLLLAAVSSADKVHELLTQNGFPEGLLPDSVVSYSLSENGDFEVELAAPCYVHFTDLVYYEKTIKGRLSYGHISDLSGIQVKKLFIWASITSMNVDPAGGTIVFSIGFFSEVHPVEEFKSILPCRAKPSSSGARGFFSEQLLPLPVPEV